MNRGYVTYGFLLDNNIRCVHGFNKPVDVTTEFRIIKSVFEGTGRKGQSQIVVSDSSVNTKDDLS